MSDPASVDHDCAADILRDIEANPHSAIKNVETDVSTGQYTRMTVDIAIKKDVNADSDTTDGTE